jgi:hypothetical protein
LSESEKQASYYFWREIGRRMGIRDIPESLEAYDKFNRAFEAAQFRYSPDNEIIARATRNLLLSWFLPKPLWKVGAPFVHAMLDDHLLDAVGLKPAPRWLQITVRGLLRLRGRFVGLLPPRRKPRLHTKTPTRTYTDGYMISELGAAK